MHKYFCGFGSPGPSVKLQVWCARFEGKNVLHEAIKRFMFDQSKSNVNSWFIAALQFYYDKQEYMLLCLYFRGKIRYPNGKMETNEKYW